MSQILDVPLRADTATIRAAYARLANIYDVGFGRTLGQGRNAAVAAVNRLPGRHILEVGVGTGLALPLYHPEKHIIGIDLSTAMLAKARERVAKSQLSNVSALLEMDAQSTAFADHQFDIAVAMFVASVVPEPRALLTELRRVVKPGGTILVINHFARLNGPISWIERKFATISAKIGWHADFQFADIFDPAELHHARITPMKPLGIFQLVELQNAPY